MEINLKDTDQIAAVAKVMKDDEPIEDIENIDISDETVIK